MVNKEFKTVKADLRLSQEREKSLQQSRGQALHQLDKMAGTLDLIRSLAKVLEREYKEARNEVLEARTLVEFAHKKNHGLLKAKHEAEQRCRRQEADIQTADETVKEVRAESAVEKARVVELEGKCGV